jgi:folate receptor
MPQSSVCIALLFSFAVGSVAQAPPCKRFDVIYASGKQLCENMWGGAFTYEPQEAKAYTMWFFDKQNPNNAVAQSMGQLSNGAQHQKCHLDFYHKDTPGPEPDNFTECHPWKDRACCAHSTVMTSQKLKEGYGEEYHWDRCGPLSPECERFFVQEACFYECDPNAGLYRKWHEAIYDPRCDQYNSKYDKAYADEKKCDHNAWQMHNMPIKASYCDAWWTACRKDLFCATDGGDYFSCAKAYKAIDERAEQDAKLQSENEDLKKQLAKQGNDDDDDFSSVPIIVCLAVVALCACGGSGYLISREKNGKPVFSKLLDGQQASGGNNGAVIGAAM